MLVVVVVDAGGGLLRAVNGRPVRSARSGASEAGGCETGSAGERGSSSAAARVPTVRTVMVMAAVARNQIM